MFHSKCFRQILFTSHTKIVRILKEMESLVLDNMEKHTGDVFIPLVLCAPLFSRGEALSALDEVSLEIRYDFDKDCINFAFLNTILII
jgi:hypothetical protein